MKEHITHKYTTLGDITYTTCVHVRTYTYTQKNNKIIK